MGSKKVKRVDEITLANAMKKMFTVLEDKNIIYLAISKRDFKALIYVLGVGIAANIVLIDILLRAPTMIERTNVYIYLIQIVISSISIIAGLWLFFRGINIVVD